MEPSGDAFNSIVFDSYNRPYNPMVNAGAIVTTDLVRGSDPAHKLERLLTVFRRYAGNQDLDVDQDVLAAELATADHNRATTYLMRAQGMIEGDVEAALALYLQQCSIQVRCQDVAMMAATLANGGVNPVTGERTLARHCIRDVLSVMYTCGMYDAAGQWAYEVGVPAKSGVSGGILCVIPGKMGICVYSPGLDTYGNSVRGKTRAEHRRHPLQHRRAAASCASPMSFDAVSRFGRPSVAASAQVRDNFARRPFEALEVVLDRPWRRAQPWDGRPGNASVPQRSYPVDKVLAAIEWPVSGQRLMVRAKP